MTTRMLRDTIIARVFLFITLVCAMLVGRACSAHAEEASGLLAPTTARPHCISLLGGYGPDGVEVSGDQKNAYVRPFMAPLWGLQYSQLVWDPVSASALFMTGLTPNSRTIIGALGVGYNW